MCLFGVFFLVVRFRIDFGAAFGFGFAFGFSFGFGFGCGFSFSFSFVVDSGSGLVLAWRGRIDRGRRKKMNPRSAPT